MPRKCACCDTSVDLMYVESADDYYCGFCHAETYHYAEYDEGYQMARRDIDYNIYDAEASVMSFEGDPPDCPRHWGYLQACLHELENENV